MKIDYTSLPRVEDSATYLYIEHAIIEQDDSSIVAIMRNKRVSIPVKSISVLLLGPGTSVTHAAIQNMSLNGLFVVWCGESMRKFYAYGHGETRNTERLLHQVLMYSDKDRHLEVVRRMYDVRFPDVDFSQKTLRQMRGAEGIRVREAYKSASVRFGVQWRGRKYDPKIKDYGDAINKALTLGNDLLYSICESVIVALGYSSAIGFIHTGHVQSFVFDIADLYKVEMVVPACFEAVTMNVHGSLDEYVRRYCRLYFKRLGLLRRLPVDISYVLGDKRVDVDFEGVNNLWDISRLVSGGVDWSDDSLDEQDDAVW